MRAVIDSEFRYHTFFYGLPGCGKTEAAASFPGLVMVSPFKRSDATLPKGIPFLNPANELELRAIIEAPQIILDKYLPGYKAETFCFDILKDLQVLTLGHTLIPEVDLGDGIKLPAKPAQGALSRPGSRTDPKVGNQLDYRIVDSHMRALIACIDDMPYNTIVTSHADTIGKKTSGDKGDPTWTTFWPAIEGWTLKRDLPGLVGDFCLALEAVGDKFLCHPVSTKHYFARNRWLKKGLTKSFDWTNKSLYDELQVYKGA